MGSSTRSTGSRTAPSTRRIASTLRFAQSASPSRGRYRRFPASPPGSALGRPTSRRAVTGATPCRRGRRPQPDGRAISSKSCGTREHDDRRDPARHPCRGGVQADRAPRHGRACAAARRHLRRPRGPAGGDRGTACAARRPRRAHRVPLGRRRRAASHGWALRTGAAAGGGGGRRAGPAPGPRHGLRYAPGGRARRRRVGGADEERGSGHGGELMTRVDDKILLRRYHEDGDLQAREQLIEQYMSLVRSLARRYSYRGEQLEDLVQIGAIGLIKAIDRFDLERGVELTTYATPNIIGEIKRHFRDKGWSVRVPRGLQELIEQLTVQLGRSPTIAELAKASGSAEEEVLEALESGRAYSSLSLSAGGGGGDGDEDLDPLESIGSEEHQYEVSEDRAVLAPGFKALDERERRILQLRFFDGLTQSQIAQQVGISQMHVSRLIRRSLEKIRETIAEDEESIAL